MRFAPKLTILNRPKSGPAGADRWLASYTFAAICLNSFPDRTARQPRAQPGIRGLADTRSMR